MALNRIKEFIAHRSAAKLVRARARSLAWALVIALCVLLAFSAPSGATPIYSIVYSFTGSNGTTAFDGEIPLGGVIADSSTGNLYGTTALGGANGAGTVFQLTPPATSGSPWTESVLFSFDGLNTTGGNPVAALLENIDGTLYGTVLNGFTDAQGGVFALTPPAIAGGSWTESVLHVFAANGSDGLAPTANLIFGSNGSFLLGTTSAGGTSGLGTAFGLNPQSVSLDERVIHSFTGSPDGQSPANGLVLGFRSLYFGTTPFGGTGTACLGGCGTVFALAPPSGKRRNWGQQVIYSFTRGADGYLPLAGLVADSSGILYGTAAGGGNGAGTVFSLTPPSRSQRQWTETTLYSFLPTSDGDAPEVGSLVIGDGGVLYGTTIGGGGVLGTVFSLTPPTTPGGQWTEAILHRFTGGSDGAQPLGGLFLFNNTIYGVTQFGGGSRNCPTGCGTVFQVTL